MVSEYIVRRRRGQRNSSRALLVSLCCFVLSFDSFASLAKAASDNPSPVTTTTPTTQPQIQTASSISTTPATQPSIENGASHSSEGRMFGLKTLGKLVKGSIGAKGGIESEESELNAEGDESNSFDASIGFENQSKSSSSSSNNNNNNNNDEEEDNSSSEIKGIATDLEAIESDIEDITAHVPQVKHSIKHKHHVPHHNNHGYNFNYGQQAGFQQPGYQPEYQQGYQPAFQQGYQQGYQPAYQSAYQPAYKPTHQQGEVYGDEGDFEVGASNQHHHSKKPKSHPKKKAKSVKYKPIKGDDKVIIFKVDEKDHHQQQQCEVKSFHLKGREIIANLMQFIRLKREKVQNIGFGLLKPLQVIGPLFDPLNLRKLVRILSPFKIASSMIRAQIKLLRKFLSITLGGGISLSHGLSNIVPMPGPVRHFVNHLFELTKAFSDEVDQMIEAIDSILANRD